MYKAISFFAGMGGIDLGFEQTNKVETVYANEIDSYPAKLFEYNLGFKPDIKDIKEVQGYAFKDIDFLVGGFPCQAFSMAGNRQGFDDSKGRGTLFFEMMRIVDEMPQKPKVIFCENVKGLVNHDKGNTFKVILHELTKRGYTVKTKVLNSIKYGNVPQQRERIYIVAFLDKVWADRFEFPEEIPLTKTLPTIWEKLKGDESVYLKETAPLYNIAKEVCTEKDTVCYRTRGSKVRITKNGCQTLLAAMGTGGNNIPIILDDHGIRKLTIRECLRLQGYPETYKIPADIAKSRVYKAIGNSVTVSVIQRIAENIIKALEEKE